MKKSLLLIVDVQNDFCPGGNLAVKGGNEIVPLVNKMAKNHEHVVLTQDWHPADHSSFASQHPGHAVYSQIEMSYGPQTLWPDHCIVGTRGAEFHKDLDAPHAEMIIRKGFRKAIDSYSAMYENDHKTPTGLEGYLRARELTKITIVGLAFDYCVRYSAEDAQARGFEVEVIEAATRAIDLNGTAIETKRSFAERGIKLT
ncbi:bifunctional nicotinamidase/pyrazinamidase [Aestuariivirga litoralis]|uniref:bifunctional nicotinamidase/pyrazinamidase n=1 Tax=Aestuariivirga litoralis TaxID=2650924 RepID=UPI0018C72236|nr:bifunctional nicotinamidase/pyrazinamidase [Aestuariivirga litoralis]MBG1232889.1 bifunctional nicotinamidase/pyrazinamidase [Aestuariivirga litoralis]